MKVYSIDGLIGSGKSTLVDKLKESLKNVKISNKKVVFIQEPVKEWMELGLLNKYYENPNRWAYTFQNSAFITRTQALYDNIKEHGEDCIFITERSVATDRHVFAKMLYKSGLMTEMEYKLYKSWYNYFSKPVDGIIYLDTNVENSIERIKKRNRDGEEGISEEYIIDLHKHHIDWLKGEDNVLRLDGNVDINDTNYNKLILEVVNFISNKKVIGDISLDEEDMDLEWYCM